MHAEPALDSRLFIFLSYGHDENLPLAQKIKEDLECKGHEVWFDSERIKPGADWEQYIEEGLTRTSKMGKRGRFILLMTPYSVRRPDGFCLNELSRAVQLNLKIFPVMVAWCEPPLSIYRLQWLDMQDCVPPKTREEQYEKKFNALIEALEHDRLDTEGFHTFLLNKLKPISFDAEIRYNLDRFSGRAWIFEAIERWLDDGDAQRIFWITGMPGMGKTAIASWLCNHWREVGAFHFCRHDNIQKIDPRRAVMSIAYQLSTQLPEYGERLKHIDLAEIDELNARSLFDLLIVQPLSANFPRPDRKVVILIDALDEATAEGKNELAGFIASEFDRTPDWLRLIVTSRPDTEVTGQFQAYSPFVIDPMDSRNERDIHFFLERELGDRASPEIVKKIEEKCNGLFIYADWVVRELKYGRLSLDRIDEFPKGLGGIYLKFLERQFSDVSIWDTSIRPALEIIAASTEPVTIKALSSIFEWNAHKERVFKRSLGSLFIMDREGIKPFHKSVIDWLSDEEKTDPYFISVFEGHKAIGDFLLKRYMDGAWDQPMMKYLPLHLCMAERADELRTLLKDLRFIRFEWAADKFSMLKQWSIIEDRSSLRMVDVYEKASASPADYDDKDLGLLVSIFKSAYHYNHAIGLLNYLVENYRRRGEIDSLKKAVGDLAWLLIHKCEYTTAMSLLKEQETISRDTNDNFSLQKSLLNQAIILWSTNEFDAAFILLVEQERICREIGDMDDLVESLSYQGLILRVKGKLPESMAMLKEQERISRNIGNLEWLQRSLLDQGLILRASGKLDDSLAILREQEELSRKAHNKESLYVSLNSQAIILRWRGDLDNAMALHTKEAGICREIDDVYGLQDSLCNQAIILRMKGDLSGSQALLHDAQRICREIDNKYGLQYALGQEAIVLRLKDDLNGAMSLHKEEECICRNIGHKRDLAMSRNNQAAILRLNGDINGAIELIIESERLLRELNYRYGLQDCLGNKALILFTRGDLEIALASLKEQELICMEMKLAPDLEKCRAAQKIVLKALECRELKAPALTE